MRPYASMMRPNTRRLPAACWALDLPAVSSCTPPRPLLDALGHGLLGSKWMLCRYQGAAGGTLFRRRVQDMQQRARKALQSLPCKAYQHCSMSCLHAGYTRHHLQHLLQHLLPAVTGRPTEQCVFSTRLLIT